MRIWWFDIERADSYNNPMRLVGICKPLTRSFTSNRLGNIPLDTNVCSSFMRWHQTNHINWIRINRAIEMVAQRRIELSRHSKSTGKTSQLLFWCAKTFTRRPGIRFPRYCPEQKGEKMQINIFLVKLTWSPIKVTDWWRRNDKTWRCLACLINIPIMQSPYFH